MWTKQLGKSIHRTTFINTHVVASCSACDYFLERACESQKYVITFIGGTNIQLSWIIWESTGNIESLPLSCTSHQISRTKQKHKKFFDIVWPILVFWWKLKCKFKKISPLNNFFSGQKGNIRNLPEFGFFGLSSLQGCSECHKVD